MSEEAIKNTNNNTNTINNTSNKVISENIINTINRVNTYIMRVYKISIEEYKSNIKEYVKRILKKIRDNNHEAKLLRLKRKELRDDISDIEVSMVGSQAFDTTLPGKKNGYSKNTTEVKYLKKLDLKEKLRNLVIESLLLEKSLNANNKLIEDFINCLESTSQKTVLKLTYIECQSNVQISNLLFYEIGTVDSARSRGINSLTNLVTECLKLSNSQ